jgi:Plasmid replication region DNA-binding N-term
MPSSLFHFRQQSLQTRVNEAAQALRAQGISPTVARIRIALGGGSPNDLAPALKHWKETILPTLPGQPTPTTGPLPRQVADLAQELWQRAQAAAVLETKGGSVAREASFRSAQSQALREQLTSLRDQLQRESLAYGELRAQAARHEAIARDALARAQESDTRERRLLRELGSLRQRVSELEATLERSAKQTPRHSRVRKAHKLRSPKSAAAIPRTRPKVKRPRRPNR